MGKNKGWRSTDIHDGGHYIDQYGTRYERKDDFLEREEVKRLALSGIRMLIDWEPGRREALPCPVPNETFHAQVLPYLVEGRERARRLMRKRTVKTVFFPELWETAEGKQLVILVEGAPRPRDDRELGV